MKILAVTILTSLDRADLDDGMMRDGSVADIVVERARRAFEAGADGIIASPQEAARIRALPEAKGRLIVTPGVRPTGAALGDQKRVATPAQAISDGANHIVVGRPVWAARNTRHKPPKRSSPSWPDCRARPSNGNAPLCHPRESRGSNCHPRASGGPRRAHHTAIPAFAGMTGQAASSLSRR